MKGDFIFSIYDDNSSYPNDFTVLWDFIVCSVSYGIVHLRFIR